MIERARVEHIPFIQRRLKSFKRIKPEVIEHIIQSSNELVFVNPEKEVVCRIRHDVKKRENRVAWLLPANENPIDLFLVMAKTLVEVSHKFPEDDDFRTWARFKDNRGCAMPYSLKAEDLVKSWYKLFPNSSHYQRRFAYTPWEDWIIYGNHGEIVKDILAYLNKPKEVHYEPQTAYL